MRLLQPERIQALAGMIFMNGNPSLHAKALRKPVRLCITICYSTCAELERLSLEQGRSRSNLAAYLIENALLGSQGRPNGG